MVAKKDEKTGSSESTEVTFASLADAAATKTTKSDANPYESEYNTRLANAEIRLKKLEEDIPRITGNIIQILAVFVALFTFVSIEFQIFRSFTSWGAAVGLSSILLGSLLAFLLVLKFFILAPDEQEKQKEWRHLMFAPLFLVLAGTVFFFFGEPEADSRLRKLEQINKCYVANGKFVEGCISQFAQ